MDGVSDNQSSHNTFGAAWDTTRASYPFSAQQPRHQLLDVLFKHSHHKKLTSLSTAGVLAFGISTAFVLNTSGDSSNDVPAEFSSADKFQQAPSIDEVQSSSSIHFQQQSSSSSTSKSQTTNSLTINGKPVPIPPNGTEHRVFSNNSQTTDVTIKSQNQQTHSPSNSNTTNSVDVTTKITNDSEGSSP